MSAPALVVAALSAALFTVAVIAFGGAMIEVHPLLAVVVNVVVVAGAAPTVWQWRAVPVWRWVVYGATVGVGAGWVALLFGVR